MNDVPLSWLLGAVESVLSPAKRKIFGTFYEKCTAINDPKYQAFEAYYAKRRNTLWSQLELYPRNCRT